mmetsp:Transcript_5975/g.17730  ORF Transcript_5975/g.17730 Transcript_5975/m.17730 type:complete len:229 (-) Transcript_5975:104-790(-)
MKYLSAPVVHLCVDARRQHLWATSALDRALIFPLGGRGARDRRDRRRHAKDRLAVALAPDEHEDEDEAQEEEARDDANQRTRPPREVVAVVDRGGSGRRRRQRQQRHVGCSRGCRGSEAQEGVGLSGGSNGVRNGSARALSRRLGRGANRGGDSDRATRDGEGDVRRSHTGGGRQLRRVARLRGRVERVEGRIKRGGHAHDWHVVRTRWRRRGRRRWRRRGGGRRDGW